MFNIDATLLSIGFADEETEPTQELKGGIEEQKADKKNVRIHLSEKFTFI